jgi:hypothetical protein
MTAPQWSIEKSEAWYSNQPWLIGCNFTPSTAANQLEFWQADTFDQVTIDRELGWAESIGFTSLRVFLHDLAWQVDPVGFLNRFDRFLAMAHQHKIRIMPVFFDDCWNPDPYPGPQPAPIPGVHNSRWWQSPGRARVNDPARWEGLDIYVKSVMSTFAHDERIVVWDLYNEPGNEKQGIQTLPFLKQVFEWAREVNPSQPLTCGVWREDLVELNDFQLVNSDVISFHHYQDLDSLNAWVTRLKQYNRPLLCTEYMARRSGSLFCTHLPVFHAENIACYNWGFVAGKTQTFLPWGSKAGDPEPEVWFHEIFHQDGRPYIDEEVECIKQATSVGVK